MAIHLEWNVISLCMTELVMLLLNYLSSLNYNKSKECSCVGTASSHSRSTNLQPIREQHFAHVTQTGSGPKISAPGPEINVFSPGKPLGTPRNPFGTFLDKSSSSLGKKKERSLRRLEPGTSGVPPQRAHHWTTASHTLQEGKIDLLMLQPESQSTGSLQELA